MKVSAIITLKKDVLDPQGKVIHETLDGMGFKDINEVRQGKYFEIDVKENGASKSKKINSSVSQDLKKRKSNVKSVDSQAKRRKRIQVNRFIIRK